MVKICKYEINPYGISQLTDRFVGLLKVDWQNEKLYVWGLISDNIKESLLTVYSLPTGYEFILTEDMHYLDTVQQNSYVWHIFYEMFTDKCKKGEH